MTLSFLPVILGFCLCFQQGPASEFPVPTTLQAFRDMKPLPATAVPVLIALIDDKNTNVWNEGDANCCPTAGKVTGTYKITRKRKAGSSGFYNEWTMTVEKAVHEPIKE